MVHQGISEQMPGPDPSTRKPDPQCGSHKPPDGPRRSPRETSASRLLSPRERAHHRSLSSHLPAEFSACARWANGGGQHYKSVFIQRAREPPSHDDADAVPVGHHGGGGDRSRDTPHPGCCGPLGLVPTVATGRKTSHGHAVAGWGPRRPRCEGSARWLRHQEGAGCRGARGDSWAWQEEGPGQVAAAEAEP